MTGNPALGQLGAGFLFVRSHRLAVGRQVVLPAHLGSNPSGFNLRNWCRMHVV